MKHKQLCLSTLSLALVPLTGACASREAAPEVATEAPAVSRPAQELAVVRLNHASAIELESTLNRLLGSGPDRVQADQRTNSLLLMARPERLAELRALISELDREQD